MHEIRFFFFSIVITSVCRDSNVRCIAMIVASNFFRNGRNAASIAAVIVFDESTELACGETDALGAGFKTCIGAPCATAGIGVRQAVAAPTAPSTSRFGAASLALSLVNMLAHDLRACMGVSSRNLAERPGRGA